MTFLFTLFIKWPYLFSNDLMKITDKNDYLNR